MALDSKLVTSSLPQMMGTKCSTRAAQPFATEEEDK